MADLTAEAEEFLRQLDPERRQTVREYMKMDEGEFRGRIVVGLADINAKIDARFGEMTANLEAMRTPFWRQAVIRGGALLGAILGGYAAANGSFPGKP